MGLTWRFTSYNEIEFGCKIESTVADEFGVQMFVLTIEEPTNQVFQAERTAWFNSPVESVGGSDEEGIYHRFG